MSLAALEELARTNPGQAYATAIAALKAQYDASLYDFAKYGLSYPDLDWRAHGDMITLLESDQERKLIVMPRGSLKSTIGVTSYVIWKLNKNPNLRILIDGETQANSKNFLREIKAQMERPVLTQMYGVYHGRPKSLEPERWTETEITIAQRTIPRKEASITCGGIGVVKVGQHYDLIIGDDYNSRLNSTTPERRLKVINHYKMNTAILDPGGEYVVIGTRYAADDVVGHILVNECGLDENGDPPKDKDEAPDAARGLL